ncbi:GNAT family N-acetyltransferase [Streptomyces sioyaensis]|uniref:GNAT family N-acetyltransferase n=1 Tax=Streptomyces sioyaensis TaxID=67364 RepID=UPI00340A121B
MSTGPSNRCKSGCYGAESSTERTLGAHGISDILRKYTWGNGYATEAAKHVVDFAFTTVGLERLEAMHHPDNPASGVSQTFAQLHQFKPFAVRWERRIELHDSFLSLACSLTCWRRLKKTGS